MTTLLEPRTAPRHVPAFPLARGLPHMGAPRIVRVPSRRYLAVMGSAAPGTPEFQEAVGALYSTAYGLHFHLRARGSDSRVGHLEALWERRDGLPLWEGSAFDQFDPDRWLWALLIELPADADTEDVATAVAGARRKHPSPTLDAVFVRDLAEGLAVEAMHVGPYATEPETIARMRETATAAGLTPRGAHHEIYLGDPRRTPPERLRTVLRQPVA